MAFWQNRSISLVDMYIDNADTSDTVGQINFSLEYDFESTTLILKIIQVSWNFFILMAAYIAIALLFYSAN